MSNNNNNNNKNTENKAATNNKVPEIFKDNKIKTKVVNFKKVVEDTLLALKDLATLELFLPVNVRVAERIKSIKETGSARNIKIRGQWKTTPPKMHIQGLRGIKINNDEAEIKFSVFDTDSKGNKKVYENKTEITKENGDKITRVIGAEYKIIYEVTEKIKTGKPIRREIMKFEGAN